MKAQTQTIEQLSRVLDVTERKVSRTARRVLGLTAEMVRDPRSCCPEPLPADRAGARQARPVGVGVDDTVFAVEFTPGAAAGIEREPLREGRARLRAGCRTGCGSTPRFPTASAG